MLFYLLSYAVTNLGALGDRGAARHCPAPARRPAGLRRAGEVAPGDGRADDGLPAVARRLPAHGGFIAKWYVFSAAVQEGHYWLAVIGVLTSVVSVFFYLRIVVMMYMTEGAEIVRPRVPRMAAAGLGLATLAVIYLGVLPTGVLDLALDSVATIF